MRLWAPTWNLDDSVTAYVPVGVRWARWGRKMSFIKENEKFEAWLRRQCAVVENDLEHKHERMAKDEFSFLRATFFRWANKIEFICRELAETPSILSVGDLHVENYGTWRDAEGRLVWGVNDFDEAAEIPFAYDLTRLATSVRLAPRSLKKDHNFLDAILEGYRDGLQHPRPILLDEEETWMREYVACSDDDRHDFWKEVHNYPDPPETVPIIVQQGLRRSLPEGGRIERFAVRRKGGGSLGRPRYVVIAVWRGGRIVREAKALAPSAWNWAHGRVGAPIQFEDLGTGPHRSPDPYLTTRDGFIFRRIAADSRKVDLESVPNLRLDGRLLRAMGFDLGAIHAAAPHADKVRQALPRLEKDWLNKASSQAAEWVKADFHEWKKALEHDK